MKRTFALLLATASLLLWSGPVLGQANVQFRHDYNETRKEADRRGLPVAIYFTTDHCPWCIRLQQDTFADPAVAKLLNERFVPLKVHAVQEPRLVEMLSIRAFPTVILASPEGKILMNVEGYQDAARFFDSLHRVLAAVTNPDWMLRDYQIAHSAIANQDYAKGVAILKAILEDGKSRPVQVNAATLLKQVEQQAAGELANAKQMLDKGNAHEASALLAKLAKDYAGTQSAPKATGMLTSLAKTTELRGPQRIARAKELLAQAKEDFRAEQWLSCLDRCDLLAGSFSDLPEATDALQMAAAIRSNPDWMQRTCEALSARLGEMYLGLAESWLQKGQTQQATQCLDQVIRTLPGTRQAEAAHLRLAQIQSLQPHQSSSPKRN